ncbi:MAG: TerD family protein [Pseudomonadota bacterium]
MVDDINPDNPNPINPDGTQDPFEVKENSEQDSEDSLDDAPEVFYPDEPRNKIKVGDEVNLTQKDPTLREITIGVGWDLKAFESDPLDLDASVFLLDRNDKTRIDEDFVFYHNLRDLDGAVIHKGDSRTGAGDGDDETITIDLTKLSFEVLKIAFVVSIYDMEFKGHDFSMVKNVYFRIVNQNTDSELFRFELDDELTEHDGLLIGMLERVGAEWVFNAIGETIEGGLGKIASDYGCVIVENMA